MIKVIQRWWWKRQREIDLQILWPSCKEQASSLEVARQAFMLHAISDPAWVRHYNEDLWPFIRTLE